MFREIVKYRDLLYMLVLRDIRIRYKQAAMGFLWAIFMPIVAICAGILIKKAMSMVAGKPMDLQGIITISRFECLQLAFDVGGILPRQFRPLRIDAVAFRPVAGQTNGRFGLARFGVARRLSGARAQHQCNRNRH